jgi:hypothetical protein
VNAITYSLSGRLGNHLQLFACARTLSLRYGWRFIYRPIIHAGQFKCSRAFSHSLQDRLDSFLVERVLALSPKVKPHASRRHHLLQTFLKPLRHVVYLDDPLWDTTGGMMGDLAPDYQQMHDTLFVIRFDGVFRNVGEYRQQLLKEILPSSVRLPHEPIENHDVGIHIRQDDIQYGLPTQYYLNAVNVAKRALGMPIRLHLFSDGDHDSLATGLSGGVPDVKVVIHRGSVVEDMMSLARYPTLILSQSWFSYWAAMFSQATVYAPPDFCCYPEWQRVTF